MYCFAKIEGSLKKGFRSRAFPSGPLRGGVQIKPATEVLKVDPKNSFGILIDSSGYL